MEPCFAPSVELGSRVTSSRVKVLRYRPDQGDLLIEAGVGWKPGVVGHVSFGADRHSSPGRSLQTGAPVMRGHPERPGIPLRRRAARARHHLGPQRADLRRWQHWGVLEVDTVEKTVFEEFEVHSFSVFANIIGLSLAQPRLRRPMR